MDACEVFLKARASFGRIETVDVKELTRPILEKTCRVKNPAAHARQSFSLRKVELGLLAVVDIDARSIPSDNLAALVSHSYFAVQHPPIRPVGRSHARFAFERLAARKGGLPFCRDLGHVVGVDDLTPFPTLESLEWHTQILEHALVAVIRYPSGRFVKMNAGRESTSFCRLARSAPGSAIFMADPLRRNAHGEDRLFYATSHRSAVPKTRTARRGGHEHVTRSLRRTRADA